MLKGFIGQKIEMSQVFDSHGRVIPITKIRVLPNVVIQIKTREKDGYQAAQIGVGEKKKASKAILGHVKKAGLEFVPRFLTEVGVDGETKSGEKISPDQFFKKGTVLDVTGFSKGKGFAGVVKRWGFAGGPRTHGQSDRERAPGSIGASATPSRVFKGMKMAGHMGNDKTTIIGLEVMEMNFDNNEVLMRGSVPGSRGTFLIIRKSKIKKKTYHEPEIPQKPVVAKEKTDETGTDSMEEDAAEKKVEKNESKQPK